MKPYIHPSFRTAVWLQGFQQSRENDGQGGGKFSMNYGAGQTPKKLVCQINDLRKTSHIH